MSIPAWIGLGSNLGDRRQNLVDAIGTLFDTPGVIVRAVSSFHETKPVGGPPGQGAFVNAAAYLDTTLNPHQLLEVLQRIEKEASRVREVRWGERTLDLDLLFFGHMFLQTEALTLPHPRLAVRRFVLAPLAEIASTFVDPLTGRMIANLLANLDRKPRLVSIDGPEGGLKETVFSWLVGELPGFGISEADLGPFDEVEADDPVYGVSAGLERKAEALKASRWAVETLRVPWLVTDFALGFDILRAIMKDPWKDQPRPVAKERLDAHVAWKRRIIDLSGIALQPTFVLALPGDQRNERRLGLTNPPLLWPESDEPDAIIAEALATCRGIEGP
jgi:2-amino-4-hydroxy-6-hydroxymethyldihydropteridine diphosphokinase